jgi:hypothetical protein
MPKNIVPDDLRDSAPDVDESVSQFVAECKPLEGDEVFVLLDARTNARYCECHISAATLVSHGTTDVPLDPDEQPEYRANREIVEDHAAFGRMKDDALARRTFSNLVVEYNTDFDEEHPLKVIGGQHRFSAVAEAYEKGINELHGLKVYFDLDPDQRLDVQLISNTNIAVSTDLFDRMQETLAGPALRNWCQEVGLLDDGEDFADKRERGRAITVRAARSFILNYFLGKDVKAKKFDTTATTPVVCKTGVADADWDALRAAKPGLWKDKKLKAAGQAFAALVAAQRSAVSAKKGAGDRTNIDFAEKALNIAVLCAWAFVAGVLHSNPVRLQRHFELKDQTGRDPLNASALAKGRHKTDSDNYRGLGYRTDAKERGRLVELFHLQAESGNGIAGPIVDLAIKQYHAKQATLEVQKAKERS